MFNQFFLIRIGRTKPLNSRQNYLCLILGANDNVWVFINHCMEFPKFHIEVFS